MTEAEADAETDGAAEGEEPTVRDPWFHWCSANAPPAPDEYDQRGDEGDRTTPAARPARGGRADDAPLLHRGGADRRCRPAYPEGSDLALARARRTDPTCCVGTYCWAARGRRPSAASASSCSASAAPGRTAGSLRSSAVMTGAERTGVARLGRLVLDDRLHGRQRGGAPERGAALDGRVQRGAERPQVGGGSGILAAQPLRGEVVDRPDDLSGTGDGRVALDLGDAEVGEQDPAVLGEEHVAGLDVPVQYAGGVRGGQRAQHPQADPGGLARLDAADVLDLVGQRVALDELHHDPRPAVVVEHVVQGDDGGVVDPRRRARLGPGTGEQNGLLALGHVQRGRQLLDGDGTVQQLVVRAPHPAHATAADDVDEPVAAREELALHLIHVSPQCS